MGGCLRVLSRIEVETFQSVTVVYLDTRTNWVAELPKAGCGLNVNHT